LLSRQIVEEITKQTEIFFHNLETCINTCNYEYVLCGMPVWKYMYHTLHSIDKWFINPMQYNEPPFHEPNLNSLDIKSEKVLTKSELIIYYNSVRAKILQYLDLLEDGMLYKKPEGCSYTRIALILGQYRHTYCHMGNINCITIIETGKWPRIVGMDGDFTKGLYE
jgi:hypothetical protein